ncbi:4-oxalocrotonate tautomerase [Anaerobacillus alkaliphilus]|uniref:Tautomerase n=1 Tax=Anaerobacillus alkaliphilus TaxID=1548597 RepID=A0A4Q0VQB1_9BACI|nr:2-hydroxymuconate tautomerase [Anaerobacillus alkaliphilus]RXI98301.1 4-oxalocrotonate tautomerase [Anaerobacillus alkaliphilus]
MPIAHIHILEGRTREQKKDLIREVTLAISRSLQAPPEKVKVLVIEIPKDNWATSGITKAEEDQ